MPSSDEQSRMAWFHLEVCRLNFLRSEPPKFFPHLAFFAFHEPATAPQLPSLDGDFDGDPVQNSIDFHHE
jgi:hypothetical protein